MVSDERDKTTSTRRDYLKYGAILAGAALAGCTSSTGLGSNSSGGNASYSVSIEPMGEIEFDGVPETWVANNGSWADMGIALGLEPPKGVWLPNRYHTQYYDAIPDVSVDKSKITQIWPDSGVSKELFYELDGDVHIMDPNFLLNRANWSQADVDEIVENIAPMFGNSIFSRGYPWHEDYRYYTLMEAFEKFAKVFQRTDRYEAYEAVHDTFQTNLAPVVPARSERPSAAVIWGDGNEPEEFYPYVFDEGTSFKHLTDLKVGDALAETDVKDFFSNRGAIDYETLLEIDPEVLLLRGQEMKTEAEFRDTVVAFMKDHDTASALTAVENGDVYRAGGLYQGPITNLVLTQRLARQLYGADSDLFDAQRVSDIVNGNM